jgi:NadR type nicotinamide-nucleotide adenylyltransferase
MRLNLNIIFAALNPCKCSHLFCASIISNSILKKNSFKIAITGPESTGKSDLAEKLATHYQSAYVPEFAREYIGNLKREYTYDDILLIAQNQIKQEEKFEIQSSNFLICDTELLVTRIWSLHKFGKSHAWIDEQIMNHHYDFFLLCNIDLPWQYDQQREHPHLRQFFFDWYRNELENYGFPYAVVSGQGSTRLQNAINLIDEFFSEK